jgi:hypothetical protein
MGAIGRARFPVARALEAGPSGLGPGRRRAALDGTQLAIGTEYEGQDNAWVHIDAVFHHTDGSLPEGELTGWGYYLTRDKPASNWYIWTQGSS